MGSNVRCGAKHVGAANAAPAPARAETPRRAEAAVATPARVLPIRSSPFSTAPSLGARLDELKPHATLPARSASRTTRKKIPPFVRNPVFEELEPRLLMSADLNPLAQDSLFAQPALQSAEFRNIADLGSPSVVTGTQLAPLQRTHEVVFVDTASPDYQRLVEDLRTGALAQGRDLEFVLIDAGRDGIRRITDTLAQKSELDAIHIVSHAADGAVQLGNARLDLQTLIKRSGAIKKWGEALTDSGDILFYGCDLAASTEGKSLVDALARLTGADVAASEDPTGAAARGGDWELEFKRGGVETAGLSARDEAWDYTLAAFTVTNTNDAGAGSLRDAIDQANAAAGADTIDFNIAGAGPHTIAPTSALPTITEAVTLDATTQPGFAGTPLIELDGSLAGAGANGVTVAAYGSTVRGLVINRFSLSGIALYGGGGVVAGNYVGTDVSGQVALGNGIDGVEIFSSGNIVGGTGVGDRNVISGNVDDGVNIDVGTTGNVILGNYIGVDATGLMDLGNASDGVLVENGAFGNTIGGATGNVIYGNDGAGVQLTTGAAGNVIQANYIGANTGEGVLIGGGSNGNTVGGAVAGTANTIVSNGGPGVSVASGAGNAILRNSISANGGLGIDLAADGVTVNDLGDADPGPNALLNYPVLTRAYTDGAGFVWIDGSLDSEPNTAFRIEFFASTAADASGSGEGESFIGAANVTTDASGNATFRLTMAGTVPVGRKISATATNLATNDTSEFAQSIDAAYGTFTVTTTDDTNDGDISSVAALILNQGADGRISLREAILAANNTVHVGNAIDLIRFDIAGAGPHTIQVGSTGLGALPTITDAVIIDGATEPDFLGTPIVELDGSLAGGNALTLLGGGSTVRGFVINRFGNGVYIASDSNLVAGNWIGLDATGTLDFGNTVDGVVLIAGTANNTIGGTGVNDRNVISGNGDDGVSIDGASGTVVIGNYIGTNAAGTAVIGNAGDGVAIQLGGGVTPAVNNRIGGTTAAERNVVAGNATNAANGLANIRIRGAGTTGTVVSGNYIGTDATGLVPLANPRIGVLVSEGASGNTIGGTAAGERNVISASGAAGIELNASTNTVVRGNYIGTDASGNAALGNATFGIWIVGAATNTVGGTAAGARNIVSGNLGDDGIEINGAAAIGNVVQGNYVGLGADGATAVGNAHSGIAIVGGSGNAIGGTAAGAGNVISANGHNGVYLGGNSNAVQGNLIGTDAGGTLDRGNTFDGVHVLGQNNIIGGTTATAGNVIAFNDLAGVSVGGASAGGSILGNSIHLNAGLGIDIEDDGVTANDAGDGDTGGNSRQNFPVLAAAVTTGADITITGSINSTASRTFRLEFFASATGDASGFGEGQIFLGTIDVTTDGAGNAAFTTPAFVAAIPVGYAIAATATDLTANDTSEFGAHVAAAPMNTAPTNTVPGAQTAAEEAVLAFSGANAISVSDPDTNVSQVVLAVTNGTLNVTSAGGAGLAGNGTASVTVTGAQAAINATIASLTYQGNLNFVGGDTLTVTSTDSASSTDSDTVAIVVTPINDAPAGTDATVTTNEDTVYAFTVANFGFTDVDGGDAISAVRIDSLTIPVGATLQLSGINVNANDVILVADITAGNLVFTPAPIRTGPVTRA